MQFTLEARVEVTMEHTDGEKSSKHINTNCNLDVSKNLDRKMYFGEDELPTKDGSKALTQTLVQGLVGNIHYAHQRGFRNDVEHMKYIVAELTRGFASVANVSPSEFKD